MYWTKSWSFTLQAIVSWQCCSCLYQAPTTSHQGRRGVADGQWNKLGGERKLDDSEIWRGGGARAGPVQVSLVHDDKLDLVYCGTGETGTISKSGLSNVLPFNEENILKLRLDSNKRLAKALQAARDYMWYHSDKTIIFSTPAICGNVYYMKYSVLQHFLSLLS